MGSVRRCTRLGNLSLQNVQLHSLPIPPTTCAHCCWQDGEEVPCLDVEGCAARGPQKGKYAIVLSLVGAAVQSANEPCRTLAQQPSLGSGLPKHVRSRLQLLHATSTRSVVGPRPLVMDQGDEIQILCLHAGSCETGRGRHSPARGQKRLSLKKRSRFNAEFCRVENIRRLFVTTKLTRLQGSFAAL